MKFNLNESIDILSRTPIVLNQLLSGLPKDWINNNEGENTWNPYDIIGHLIHGEKTDWIPRVTLILSDTKDKTFEPFDRFAQFENSKGKTLQQLLDEFSILRQVNIETLKTFEIDEHKLSRVGKHPALGETTLSQLLSTWVVHDLSHINQITRVMMKNYINEVGPWKAYISLLN